jgi:hypothetical protein
MPVPPEASSRNRHLSFECMNTKSESYIEKKAEWPRIRQNLLNQFRCHNIAKQPIYRSLTVI